MAPITTDDEGYTSFNNNDKDSFGRPTRANSANADSEKLAQDKINTINAISQRMNSLMDDETEILKFSSHGKDYVVLLLSPLDKAPYYNLKVRNVTDDFSVAITAAPGMIAVEIFSTLYVIDFNSNVVFNEEGRVSCDDGPHNEQFYEEYWKNKKVINRTSLNPSEWAEIDLPHISFDEVQANHICLVQAAKEVMLSMNNGVNDPFELIAIMIGHTFDYLTNLYKPIRYYRNQMVVLEDRLQSLKSIVNHNGKQTPNSVLNMVKVTEEAIDLCGEELQDLFVEAANREYNKDYINMKAFISSVVPFHIRTTESEVMCDPIKGPTIGRIKEVLKDMLDEGAFSQNAYKLALATLDKHPYHDDYGVLNYPSLEKYAALLQKKVINLFPDDETLNMFLERCVDVDIRIKLISAVLVDLAQEFFGHVNCQVPKTYRKLDNIGVHVMNAELTPDITSNNSSKIDVRLVKDENINKLKKVTSANLNTKYMSGVAEVASQIFNDLSKGLNQNDQPNQNYQDDDKDD